MSAPDALHVLPPRVGGAAENMANDFMLLERYPDRAALRLRHYSWHRPAFTFGFSQKFEFVRSQLPPDDAVELCRRPTGGGVVDHRQDWTYALVIPRGHSAYDARAIQSYREVHQCLAEALRHLGQSAEVKQSCDPAEADADGRGPCVPGVCFLRAELYDVVTPATGQKIAGAAQKRTKHGLLFQGSISRQALGTDLDWDAFLHQFVQALSSTLRIEATPFGWPDWSQEEVDGLVDQYSSPEWNEFR